MVASGGHGFIGGDRSRDLLAETNRFGEGCRPHRALDLAGICERDMRAAGAWPGGRDNGSCGTHGSLCLRGDTRSDARLHWWSVNSIYFGCDSGNALHEHLSVTFLLFCYSAF